MKIHWEERTSNLSDQCSRLKEENRNLEARRSQLEQENSRLNNEIADQIRKISVVEANYQNLDHVSRRYFISFVFMNQHKKINIA